MEQKNDLFEQTFSTALGSEHYVMEEPESPRMDYLIGELRIAMSLARAGLRADGLYGGGFQCKLSCDDSEVAIIPLPVGVHGPLLPLLKSSLEDQGFVVAMLDKHGLVVLGCKRLNPNIH